ncbi:MAG TPA: hypothetical protein VGG03_28090 [Thermoanaerobaculia bacterium]
MKKIALFVALLLCICTLAARGQSPAPTLSKAEFLASLGSPEPLYAKGFQMRSSCTVTLNCDVGYHLTCSSGSGDCQSGPTWVKCDGVQQDCPVCAETCPCGERTCFGWSYCDSGLRWIECDGHRYSCIPVTQC